VSEKRERRPAHITPGNPEDLGCTPTSAESATQRAEDQCCALGVKRHIQTAGELAREALLEFFESKMSPWRIITGEIKD
jgi:hypothetical protein